MSRTVYEAQALIGSGTLPFTHGIAGNVRAGNPVILTNPEDLVAMAAFATSGVTIGTSAVEILGPNRNPLSQSRLVIFENTGLNTIFISHQKSFTSLEGFELEANILLSNGSDRRLILPILRNVSVWARTDNGTSSIKLIIL